MKRLLPSTIGGRVLLLSLLLLLLLAVLTMRTTYGFFSDTATATVSFQAGTWATPTPMPLSATVDIKPESLQKKSKGEPVTAYIELPADYDVRNIVVDSVRLCRGTAACSDGVPPDGAPGAKPKVGDYDNDGIPDLKVTFGREDILDLVKDMTPPATVTFTVSGLVNPPGRTFAGSDTVKLVDPEPTPTATPSATPTLTATATVTPTVTATVTPAMTPTIVATPTIAPTMTATPTPEASATAISTPTPTPTASLNPTAAQRPPLRPR